MNKVKKLRPGKYYHIYNCGINGENIFKAEKDYKRFLHLYEKHIFPICETYAWVLMKNHFHLLVKTDECVGQCEKRIRTFNSKIHSGLTSSELLHLHFSRLFNAYAKYFNIKYERHGSLFERPFKRKEIEHINYFRQVVIYIHQNPVHHGFCDHVLDYGWSSYLTCISLKPTNLGRDEVIGWFDNVGNFKTNHNSILDRGELENYLGL